MKNIFLICIMLSVFGTELQTMKNNGYVSCIDPTPPYQPGQYAPSLQNVAGYIGIKEIIVTSLLKDNAEILHDKEKHMILGSEIVWLGVREGVTCNQCYMVGMEWKSRVGEIDYYHRHSERIDQALFSRLINSRSECDK